MLGPSKRVQHIIWVSRNPYAQLYVKCLKFCSGSYHLVYTLISDNFTGTHNRITFELRGIPTFVNKNECRNDVHSRLDWNLTIKVNHEIFREHSAFKIAINSAWKTLQWLENIYHIGIDPLETSCLSPQSRICHFAIEFFLNAVFFFS